MLLRMAHNLYLLFISQIFHLIFLEKVMENAESETVDGRMSDYSIFF